MPKVRTTRTEAFVRTVYGNIGGYISGATRDTHGVGRVFWSTVTYHLFKQLHTSYEIRSLGGADDLGNKFKPLKKETIARRPIGKGELSKFGLTKRGSGTGLKDRKRGLLSPEEDKAWRKKYSNVLKGLILKMSAGRAKEIAARSAWNHVKNEGAKTKLDTLGNRDVLIMRVTDSIFNSLKPSSLGLRSYRPRKNQLVEQADGKLKFGTLVEHAKFHNNTRPVIPDNIQPWIDKAVGLGFDAVFNHIKERVL